ncbi:uncharacterized protein A1O9_02765 [Exophiala aquamarina CBS 119918]|uniref:Metallo-beta-lactamase domain-containing protein n=1 Tax=Exophiala aquamarina CBS 119918 TaxID=1182545 RepID=A0A072PZY0_9EURO|nr:uncharacterized protein A1O9_02765 [Exophiala aquamarina CBS 119918]KEF61200.1 hypothetical protein A1O9_02765 [Exophiala aquamarina CBS 119918]
MTGATNKIDIPESSVTVDVSIINSTSWVGNVPYWFSIKPVYPGLELNGGPSYAFYIHHRPSDSRLLFDLGVRKDFRTHLSPHLLKAMEKVGMQISVEKDVSEILAEHGGVQPGDIDSIIFSHHHFDHVGDTTKFPGTTRLVVGPGYKQRYLPGYPENPEAAETTTDTYEGRGTVEIEFAENDHQVSTIGKFKAYDYFDDGSFYLLSTPGHTVGHLSALARTTAREKDGESTFLFLGGDIARSCMVFRPTEKYPLPETISPAPNSSLALTNLNASSSCPGDFFASMHRLRNEENGAHKSHTTPFCLAAGPDEDLAESQRSVDKLAGFDGQENVLTILAHDNSLLDVLEYFPNTANLWKRKGWGPQGHWRFLAPLMKGKGAEEDKENKGKESSHL